MLKLSQEILHRHMELKLHGDYFEYVFPEENFQMPQKARKLKRTIDSTSLLYDCFWRRLFCANEDQFVVGKTLQFKNMMSS